MIQRGTKLNVADNSGAKLVECFNIIGKANKKSASLGDLLVCVVKKAEPRREVKNHQVVKAVIVRQRSNFRRKDGSYVHFDDNACCILNDKKELRGNRILGPIPREMRELGFEKIITLAKDVV
ncbi:50S ribosomal protein L14 [Candidatus Gribaldobacteria bacterium]|nr:50S ribosomal protein L14 [Candidatus Gribaldobacteria bacterium]